MNISITPELEQFVQEKVRSGMYQSASELFREALRLLQAQDELRRRRIEAMDRFIQTGIDEAEEGSFSDPATVWAELDQIIDAAERKHV